MITNTNSKILSLQAHQIIKEINWPLITSIGIHGLFFTLIFPQWHSANNPNPDNLSNTTIVELNSIEQTRLPDLSPRTSFNWDNFNTLPSSDSQLPPISSVQIPTPPSNFDMGMNLPSPPSYSSSLPSPPSLPPATVMPPMDYSYSYNSNIPSPPDSELTPPPPLNENAIATLPTPTMDFNTPVNGKVIDITADPQQEREVKPEEAQIREKIFANTNIEITSNPRDIINGRITPNSTDIGLPSNYNNITTRLQRQSQNTTDEEARKNYIAWAKEVQTVTPKQLTFAGIYPKDACVGKLEGTATYGVTVNSAGNVINSQLIKSSGYPLFNDQALRQIRSRNFSNESGADQPYHVYVNFNYDSQICPSLSISNVGETTPLSNTPSTEVNSPLNTPKMDVNTPPAVNNLKPIMTPKKETIENGKNNLSTPIPLKPVLPSPQIKPLEAEIQKNQEVKSPVENKTESLSPIKVNESTTPEVIINTQPSPDVSELEEKGN